MGEFRYHRGLVAAYKAVAFLHREKYIFERICHNAKIVPVEGKKWIDVRTSFLVLSTFFRTNTTYFFIFMYEDNFCIITKKTQELYCF